MEREHLLTLMIVIGAATPALAGLIYILTRLGALGGVPRSRLVLLVFLGPANLLLWLAFNRYLNGIGHRSVVGIVFAALVFAGVGFGAGFLRGKLARQAPTETDEQPGGAKTAGQE